MRNQILSVGVVGVVLFCLYFSTGILVRLAAVYAEITPGGFVVSYYGDTEFRERVAHRARRSVVHNYGEGRPARGVPVNNHSSRWEGWLHIRDAGDYVFFLQSQGGARLWIAEELVVDKWDDHQWVPGAHGSAYLSNGVHKIVIEHYKTTGPGAIRLRWKGEAVPANTVMGAPYVRKRSR